MAVTSVKALRPGGGRILGWVSRAEGRRSRGIARRRAWCGDGLVWRPRAVGRPAEAASCPRHSRDACEPGDLPRRTGRCGLGAGSAGQRRGRYLYLRGRPAPHHRTQPVVARTGPGPGLRRGRLRASPGAWPAGRRFLRAAPGPGAPAAQERRSGRRGGGAQLRARAVARCRVRRSARAVRGNRAGTARRAALRGRGRTGRRPAHPGPARGSGARSDRYGRGSPAPGADARPADDRAVPLRAARRIAAGLPGRQARAGRGTRHRSWQ